MSTMTWPVWKQSTELRRIDDVTPLLASWDSSTHPSQIRLQSYLDEVECDLTSDNLGGSPLYLHIDVDVKQSDRLLRHYDLENYLTPVATRLRHLPIVMARAIKYVGGGSRICVGAVEPAHNNRFDGNWHYAECDVGSGASSQEWKYRLRHSFQDQAHDVLPDGPVEVIVAWKCSPSRNWVNLWKQTGDAMGPFLGEPDPSRPFAPSDDRITSLQFHLHEDPTVKHDVSVRVWYRSAVDV